MSGKWLAYSELGSSRELLGCIKTYATLAGGRLNATFDGMGVFNSSATRVAPLFDQLLRRDASGASWVDALLALGSRPDRVGVVPRGLRLVTGHEPWWGSREKAIPAPQSLLEYLVEHMDAELVRDSRDTGEVRANREALSRRDDATIAEALLRLRRGERGRHWFVLEGESRPDAVIETDRLVVCVEGKRTERACTTHTSWMRRRGQLIRHMDAAMDHYPGKDVLGLLIVEGPGGADALQPSVHWMVESAAQYEWTMIEDSLPHRSGEDRRRIANGILGVTTWQAVCAATGVDWASLPVAV